MKRSVIVGLAALAATSGFAQGAKPAPATGYEIKMNVKPYQKQWLYLGYYYGSVKGLADSAFIDASSNAIFKGKKPLPQGIYIVASPTKTILFEVLVGKNQHFSVTADTAHLDKVVYTNSTDNSGFAAYTAYINPRARAADEAGKKLKASTDEAEKKTLQATIDKNVKEIEVYRGNVIKQQPESMLAVLFKAMSETKFPAAMQKPQTRQDSMAAYQYGKAHYWDGIDFTDGRIVRTPIFENKLKSYLSNWISPEADSIIHEFNWMIALGRNDTEMFKYLIGYYVDNYMYPKVMGQDKVFVHVYERFFSGENKKVDWLNERQMKLIQDRYYMLMANQLGGKAWDMELVDTTGATKSLYNVNADYTVVTFWDAHCGKCKEELPKMDTLYNKWWKGKNVQVYAVMVNEESALDWKPFIRQYGAGWVHVHQTKEMKEAEEKAGKPNFRQLYDMRTTPTLFLLDKDKNIIAKNLSLEDLDNLLKNKMQKS